MADGRIFGRRPEFEIKPLSEKKLTFKIGGTGQDQDLVTLLDELFQAWVGTLKNPPVEPNCAGIGCITVQQIPHKRKIYDDVKGEDFSVTSQDQITITSNIDPNLNDYTVIGDSPNAYAYPLEDNGACAGKVNKECIMVAESVIVNAPLGTAYEVCLTPYCFAPPLVGGEAVEENTTVATDDFSTTPLSSTPQNIQVLGNDTDPEGNVVSFTSFGGLPIVLGTPVDIGGIQVTPNADGSVDVSLIDPTLAANFIDPNDPTRYCIPYGVSDDGTPVAVDDANIYIPAVTGQNSCDCVVVQKQNTMGINTLLATEAPAVVPYTETKYFGDCPATGANNLTVDWGDGTVDTETVNLVVDGGAAIQQFTNSLSHDYGTTANGDGKIVTITLVDDCGFTHTWQSTIFENDSGNLGGDAQVAITNGTGKNASTLATAAEPCEDGFLVDVGVAHTGGVEEGGTVVFDVGGNTATVVSTANGSLQSGGILVPSTGTYPITATYTTPNGVTVVSTAEIEISCE